MYQQPTNLIVIHVEELLYMHVAAEFVKVVQPSSLETLMEASWKKNIMRCPKCRMTYPHPLQYFLRFGETIWIKKTRGKINQKGGKFNKPPVLSVARAV